MSPEKNQDPYRNFFRYSIFDHKHFIELLNRKQITPTSSPKYIDLFSGNAPVADLFHRLGWQDITAIDICEPDPEPNFPIKWFYGDLLEFSRNLRFQPEKTVGSPFSLYSHQFDILTCMNPYPFNRSPASSLDVYYLAEFFLKKDGVYINSVLNPYSLLTIPLNPRF